MAWFHDLNTDVQNAIKWFAAEFHYLKELKEELEKIKQDTAVSDQEREYKRIRHTWYYIGRCERRAERKVQVVIEDLKKAIQTNPNLVTLEKQIEISSEKLLKAFSFYTGDFKNKLVNILVDIKIRKEQFGDPARKAEMNMRQTADEAEQYIDTLIQWVGGLEASLRRVENIENKPHHSMKKEYLDLEKKYTNFFITISRILKIIEELCIRKKRGLEQFKQESNILYNHFQGLKKLFFGKRLEKGKKEAIVRLEAYRTSLLDSIAKQEKFILQSMGRIGDEEKALKSIYNLPIFASANQQEKKLIEEMVYKRKSKINEIIYFFTNYSKILLSQKETLNNFELDPAREYRYNYGDVDGVQFVVDTIEDFCNKVNKMIDLELEAISKCNKTVEYLMGEARRVIEENKAIESFGFDQYNLAEVRAIIGKELLREENKLQALQKLIQVHRTISSPMMARHLIAVHLSQYFPEEGIMRPTGDFPLLYHGVGLRENPRHTIHFALNGPTPGFGIYGQMGGRKYSIIIPLDKIISRIVSLGPPDTMVFGDLTLPAGTEIITTEKDNVVELQRRAGNATVVPIKDGETLEDATVRRIRARGYTVLTPASDAWWTSKYVTVDEKTLHTLNLEFGNFFERIRTDANTMGRLISYVGEKSHFYSFWSSLEDFSETVYKILNDKTKPPHPNTIELIIRTLYNYEKILDLKRKGLTHQDEQSACNHIAGLLKIWLEDLKKMPTSKASTPLKSIACSHPIPEDDATMASFLDATKKQQFL
jgi:hypothetical protein